MLLMRRCRAPAPLSRPTGNRIAQGQLSALRSLHSLHSLDLEGNPCSEDANYRAKTFDMLAVLPHFAVVDELNKQGEMKGPGSLQGLCPLAMGAARLLGASLALSAPLGRPCIHAGSLWGRRRASPARPALGRRAGPAPSTARPGGPHLKMVPLPLPWLLQMSP